MFTTSDETAASGVYEFEELTDVCICIAIYAKQKHLGCKKVRGQSEATLQTGRHDQKV